MYTFGFDRIQKCDWRYSKICKNYHEKWICNVKFCFGIAPSKTRRPSSTHACLFLLQPRSYYSILSFVCMFVLLYLFLWPLCCLLFFDIRNLITPLVSAHRHERDSNTQLHVLERNYLSMQLKQH